MTVTVIASVLVLTLLHLGRQETVAPEIRMSYSTSYTNTIGGLQPSSGRTFLLIHLTVDNRGYQNFTANPFRDMYVVTNGQTYNVSAAYFFLSNPFPTSNLRNNDSANGDVAFEVPQVIAPFTPQWRLSLGIRLNWVPS